MRNAPVIRRVISGTGTGAGGLLVLVFLALAAVIVALSVRARAVAGPAGKLLFSIVAIAGGLAGGAMGGGLTAAPGSIARRCGCVGSIRPSRFRHRSGTPDAS